MKTNLTEAEQSQIRRLAFEALTEYPDGRIPANLDLRDLFPEIFQSSRVKSSDKKRAEEALHLLREVERHRSSLESDIASATASETRDGKDRLVPSLARLGLYELAEKNGDAIEVFRDLLRLFKAYIKDGQKAAERLEKAERLLFTALLINTQYFVWLILAEAGAESQYNLSFVRKAAQKLGYDAELLPPPFAERLVQGILAHRELLDAALIKFFKHKYWEGLPNYFRNILRMGLYEILIGLASPMAVIDSLSSLLDLLLCQDEALRGEEEKKTARFIKNQMVKSACSIGRALAFQIIYSLAFTDINSIAMLREAYALSPYNISGSADILEKGDEVYSWKLVRGVWEHAKELDAIIDKYSHKWRVDRMGKIEITLLRLALYEMIYEQMPARIVMSEIMDIADMFGAEDAKNLVNGILDAVSKSDEFHFITRSG